MPEDLKSISSSRSTNTEIARHAFTIVRRGFDTHEVRSFLEQLARELSAAEQREEELRRQLAEAEARASNPVIDETTLSAALGQQTAQVLRNAHDEAARIAMQAEATAAELVREAQRQAVDVRVQAESAAAERIAEAEIVRRSLRQEADEEVALILEGSQAEAESVVARGIEEGQAMVEQAQETRRRVLADMAQRRRAMTLQIEQFRAARDELAAAVMGLRDSVDAVVVDLARADDSARSAAAEVARLQAAEPSAEEIIAEVAAAEAALDDARVRAAASAESRAVPEPVEITAVFDIEVESGETGAVEAEHVELVVVETEEEAQRSGPADAVEGLFARLRSGGTKDVAPAGAEGGTQADGEGEAAGRGDVEVEAGAATPPAEASAGTEGEEPDPDEPLRSRRSVLLDPIADQLSKRLKRALQDDQNRLLDRLRSGSGTWSAETLPPEGEHRSLYADVSTASLREAVAAGITFGREQRGDRRGRAPSPDAKVVAAMAERLAGTVVALLRRRMEGAEGESDDVGAESVGAAYREWRGTRIERLVGDYVLEAFSAGVLAAAGSGSALRWVLGGDAPACADCDDNALAGAVPAGDEFPTGHLHPPAHAGCRCLVVPTPA